MSATRRVDRRWVDIGIVPRALWLSVIFFVLLHPAAVIGVLWTTSSMTTMRTLEGATPVAWIAGATGCVALAIWPARSSAFLRTRIVGFVLFEGLFLGGIVTYSESYLPGVVLQLSFAAFSAIIGVLAILASEYIRSASPVVRVFLVTAAGYLVFALHNVSFSRMELPLRSAWGAGSYVVLGIPIGLLLGLLLVPLVSYALVRRVARAGAASVGDVEPTYPWRVALGIVSTIVWPWEEAPRDLLTRGLLRSG